MNDQCPNGYNDDTFMESFGSNDDDIKKCNSCNNMSYEDGTMICTL